jgi:cation:H+ antiporter
MDGVTTYQLALIALGAIGFGIWLLLKGGDMTIDAAVRIAERSGLSKLFIAATIVAFGTSAPELFTSVNANLSGFPGISVGNIIGSNIANVLLVIGVSAVIAPVLIDRKQVRVDTWMMIIATIAMAVAVWAGMLPFWAGLGMLATIVAYVFYQYKASRIEVDEDDEDGASISGNPYLLVTLGITTLVVGSEILVQGAVAGGYALGVPEAVIGMTVIAFGTSVPELTACVAAARKGQSDMIVGGIVGSNIFNILSVMAFSAAVKPLIIDPRFAVLDLPIVLVVTAVFAVFLLFVGRIGKTAGLVIVASYLIFTAAQYGGLAEVISGSASLSAPGLH